MSEDNVLLMLNLLLAEDDVWKPFLGHLGHFAAASSLELFGLATVTTKFAELFDEAAKAIAQIK